MTSYGGPSLGPESLAHGSQRVYLGQMVKDLMVQPWSLGQPENIWHGILRWSTHAPHHTSRPRRRLLAPRRSRRRIARRLSTPLCLPRMFSIWMHVLLRRTCIQIGRREVLQQLFFFKPEMIS